MGRDDRLSENADQLDEALAATRRTLAKVTAGEQRARRALAIDQAAQYVALLREAGEQGKHARVPFWFKREFPDGRWDVAERLLEATPRVGDVVSFDDGRRWRVRDSQLVKPRPARKPPREFFVCALAS
ncbi:MAG: hypothetical protein ACXVZ4_04485 [Gaiellaceae bacterium]